MFAKRERKFGIYLLGDCHFDPYTDEKFYCVKVGNSSTDLVKRVNSYFSCNPYIAKVSLKELPRETSYKFEKACHELLESVSITRCPCDHTLEWFRVSRENYLEICEKGFKWFEEKGLNF